MIGLKNNLFLIIVLVTVVRGYEPPKKTTVPCHSDKDCETHPLPYTFCSGNTAWTSGVCSCTKDFVLRQVGNKFECLEEAKLFHDPCVIDDQCVPKFGEDAACINNKCKCRPGAHFINLLCWKSSKLGETCRNPNNCVATQNSFCSGVCSCAPGYVANPSNTQCLKIAQKLGDPCEDSVQCSPVNYQSTCQYNVCLCPPGYNTDGYSGCFKPNSNNSSSLKESVAMIFIALFLFCLKF